jgi:hypothetical protein
VGSKETLDHLIVGCVFSREAWFKVRPVNWWLDARKRVPKPRHQAFDSLVFLVARQLWLEHNGRVFRGGGVTSLSVTLVARVWDILELWSRAGLVCRSLLVTM